MRLSWCPIPTGWGNPSGTLQQSLAPKGAFKLALGWLHDHLQAGKNDRGHASVAAVDLLHIAARCGILRDVDHLVVDPVPIQHSLCQAAITAPAGGEHGQPSVDHQYRL